MWAAIFVNSFFGWQTYAFTYVVSVTAFMPKEQRSVVVIERLAKPKLFSKWLFTEKAMFASSCLDYRSSPYCGMSRTVGL